jgi:metal-responsive CopG/Arc/MetJ family transcriptional regulator
MKRIELWIPDEWATKLDEMAWEGGEARASIIRGAIRDMLARTRQAEAQTAEAVHGRDV